MRDRQTLAESVRPRNGPPSHGVGYTGPVHLPVLVRAYVLWAGRRRRERVTCQDGINDYLIGEWRKARVTLSKCPKQMPGDRPALRIFQAREPSALDDEDVDERDSRVFCRFPLW